MHCTYHVDKVHMILNENPKKSEWKSESLKIALEVFYSDFKCLYGLSYSCVRRTE